MAVDLERKKYFYNRCDPQEWLPAGDDRYEPFDDKGLRGPERPGNRLLETIELSQGPTTQLFSGLIGSGKSTELRLFAEMAKQAGYFVAFVDVLDRPVPLVDRARPIQTADVLFSVCLTIDEAIAGTPAEPSWSEEFLKRVWSALFTKVEVAEVKVGKSPLEAKLRLVSEPTFRQELNQRLEASPLRFREGVHEFVRESDSAIKKKGLGRGLVVVLDSLEKIAETEVGREEKEAAFREVFLARPEMVRVPCHIVYPVSPFMIQYSHELGALYDSEPMILPMVRVRERTTDKPDPQGMPAMLNALNRRTPIQEMFESDAIAKNLVLASGGVIRDLLRFLREALVACPPECDKITEEVANRAIKRVQRTYREGLLEEFRGPLETTRKMKSFPLSDQTRTLFSRLLKAHMLLRYHNEDEWYDAHPLLWEFLRPG
jgi:hypothetical protein